MQAVHILFQRDSIQDSALIIVADQRKLDDIAVVRFVAIKMVHALEHPAHVIAAEEQQGVLDTNPFCSLHLLPYI